MINEFQENAINELMKKLADNYIEQPSDEDDLRQQVLAVALVIEELIPQSINENRRKLLRGCVNILRTSDGLR